MPQQQETPQTDTHDLSFELDSPQGHTFAQALLNAISDNNGIFRIAIEIESTDPFQLSPNMFNPDLSGEERTIKNTPTKSSRNNTPPSSTTTEQPPTPEPTQTPPPTEADEADEEDEPTEEIDCEYCGEGPFDTPQAFRGHLAWCEEKPDSDEEAAETDDILDEDTSLKPGTWKFRAASLLAHKDQPLTPDEAEGILAGTEWEQSRKRLSSALSSLHSEGIANRGKRETGRRGPKPYSYELTEPGHDLLEKAEANAKTQDELVFPDLATDSDVEDAAETRQDTPSADNLKPGTGKFIVASVLNNTAKPVIPGDIEQRIEDTEWETSRSSISSVLTSLYQEGFVNRERRTSQHGKPYEYTLTDEGAEIVQDVIEKVESDEDKMTYEEVVAGK